LNLKSFFNDNELILACFLKQWRFTLGKSWFACVCGRDQNDYMITVINVYLLLVFNGE